MKTLKKKLALIIALLLCLSAFVGCDLGNDNKDEKDTENSQKGDVAISLGDVDVTSQMMSFFLNDTIMNWYSQYSGYTSLFSVDLSKDLHSQQYGAGYEAMFLGDFEGTWYDYFLNQTLENVKVYVMYANAAKAAGLTLTEQDEADIDVTINDIKTSLKEKDSDFSDRYGKGVSEGDVRDCYELIFLASKASDHKLAEIESMIEKDDGYVKSYISEHPEGFYSIDVLKYAETLNSGNFGTEVDFDGLVDHCVKAAEKLLEASSPQEFVYLIEYEEETLGGENGNSENETDYDYDEIDVEKYKQSIEYGEIDMEINEWLFGYVSSGSTKCFRTERVDERGFKEVTIEVYYVLAPCGLDHSYAKNFAYVLAENEDTARAFKEEFASSDMTLDDFGMLANTYYPMPEEGGLPIINREFSYEVVERRSYDFSNLNLEKILAEWLNDEERKPGDLSDVIAIETYAIAGPSYSSSSSVQMLTQYAVFFFAGDTSSEGEKGEIWYLEGFASAVDDQYGKWFEDLKANSKIEIDSDALDSLNVVPINSASIE